MVDRRQDSFLESLKSLSASVDRIDGRRISGPIYDEGSNTEMKYKHVEDGRKNGPRWTE